MLIARRVKIWVEPLLYRTIVLQRQPLEGHLTHSWDTLPLILKSKPASFLHHAVRNLFCVVRPHQKLVLMQCRGIENLWIGGLPDRLSDVFLLIEDLPLQQLYCNLTDLFGPQRQIDFTHRLFARITRLELFDRPDSFDPKIWCNLGLIPQLTHLAFSEPASGTIWPSLLRTCHSLRVLVALGRIRMQAVVNSHQDKEELVKDARFVAIDLDDVITDWYMGAHAGINYWSRAEDFIAKRRSGEIYSLQYWVDEDESRNI
ncbi:hypothetical protein B0H19DRAFT_1141066 [Mycena capillaripes]|nr:hypothetical protein B0H19DRAFT_1141066 [Mycena capillaripes]